MDRSRPRALRARRLAIATLVAATLLPVGGARAAGAELSAIAGAYAAYGGTIPVCMFTSAQLNAALSEAGGDIQQYGSDLLAAIQRALSARASGACDKHSGATVITTTTITTIRPPGPIAPAPVIVAPPAPPVTPALVIPAVRIPLGHLAAPTDAGVPAPLWILAAAGVLFALGGAVAATWRLRGWDPAWAASARHAWGEAGYRASGAWADFTDWARPQR